IARETGKVLWDARAEVAAMISKVAISARAYTERTGRREVLIGGVRHVVRHRPHGVVAVLGPCNFPGHLPNGHIVPALLAGNTVVFKPSELTPLVAAETLRCWLEAGLPRGVLNVVQGAGQTGALLVSHPDIDGLFFTGSYETGKMLHQQFSGRPEKILALEMGGNNPLVIWRVSDPRAAAYHAIQSAFLTTGQRCTCARRLIVSADEQGRSFLQLLLEMARRIRIGAYTDQPEPFMGPLVSMPEAQKLLTAQAALQAAGGRILLEMQSLTEKLPFLSPGIVDMTTASQRPDKEYFGPLLQVIRVPDFEQAINAANQTAYGLTAAVFTDEEGLYERFRRKVRTGLVNWNRPTTGASSAAPFGGIGISGNHRPSAYYAADYCAYPVASMESDKISMPPEVTPGLTL
ncbi:MAG: succinylglutamate-semialdehyde dehydrogenase, partial [Desulfatitalea sp.]|nr:succinylglutamate-semialdehyde dehydrogenase [Desulfatitalea sp.]